MSAAISAAVIGAGVSAYSAYSANKQQEENQAAMQGAYGSKNFPAVPDYGDEFLNGYYQQQGANRQALQDEQGYRNQYDPANLARAYGMYNQYLPKFARTNLRALKKVDPESVQGRKDLYSRVSGDLGQGYNIDPALAAQTANDVRGAQAARGNILGNAAISQEAMVTAQQRQQMYQTRLANMMNFLRGPTPQDQFGKLAGAGSGALVGATSSTVQPGFQYVEEPRGWGQIFMSAAQSEQQNKMGIAGMQAQAFSQPQAAQVNPYMAALASAAGSATQYYGAGSSQGGSSQPIGSPYGNYGGTYTGSYQGKPVVRAQAA